MNKIDLFLDSGAYSAWTKGAQISIDEYIKFIKDNLFCITTYCNLDDIQSPEKTWENQEKMENEGLSPLPVYHIGEDKKYLDRILGYEYFALGGMALQSLPARIEFYDEIFSLICSHKNGFLPTHKIHGFGLTSLQLMIRYPWYSVDSTSWVLTGRFGSIFVPRYRNGEYIYDENSWKVCVSNRAGDESFQEGKHIETFSQMERDQILHYMNDKGYVLGKSEFRKERASYKLKLKEGEKWHGKEESDGQRIVETVIERGISNIYQLRDEMNIIYFLDLEKFLPEWPWAFKRKVPKGFFV